jgi:ABC-type glycerol-3-phosphate transport system substrate-binding protein
MKRLLMVVMALTTAALAFGSGSTAPSAGGKQGGTQSSTADYSKGFPQRVTIEIPVYERAFEGWNISDNYWTRWVQKEFGDKYNVTVKFVGITRNAEVQDFTQLLASHRAPDIIFHYDMPQALNYYNEGVMQEIKVEEIQKYAPTYWNYTGKTIQQYGTIDGKKMFFFAERPAADNYTTLIRKDWVEKAGYKVEQLTDLETFNAMLAKWRDLGLGKYGMNLVKDNFTYSYAFRDWPVNDKERALYSELAVADFTWKPTHDYLKNLNYLYNNNLMDREFYLRDTEAKWKAEFVAGRVGTFGFYLANTTDLLRALTANDSSAEVAVMPASAGIPKGKVPQGRAYWPFGMIMGINYESTDMERIAVWMYLEWMSQQNNLFALQNGIAGQTYTLDASGIPVKATSYSGEARLSQNNNKDYWCLVTEGYRYADEKIFWAVNRAAWAPPGNEALVDTVIATYRATTPYRTPDALFTVNLSKVSEYKADLNALWQQLYVQCVTCPEAQFETTYTNACRQFLAAGYQEILDEKQKAINAGQYMR